MGVLAGFGVVSLLTIGAFVLLLAVLMTLIGLVVSRLRGTPVLAAFPGLSVAPGYLAWLNRDGPGTVCGDVVRGSQHCVDEWSPWPFGAVALMLLGGGSALLWVVHRRRIRPVPCGRSDDGTSSGIGG